LDTLALYSNDAFVIFFGDEPVQFSGEFFEKLGITVRNLSESRCSDLDHEVILGSSVVKVDITMCVFHNLVNLATLLAGDEFS